MENVGDVWCLTEQAGVFFKCRNLLVFDGAWWFWCEKSGIIGVLMEHVDTSIQGENLLVFDAGECCCLMVHVGFGVKGKNLLVFDGPSWRILVFDKGMLFLVYKLRTCWCLM